MCEIRWQAVAHEQVIAVGAPVVVDREGQPFYRTVTSIRYWPRGDGVLFDVKGDGWSIMNLGAHELTLDLRAAA